ncbi:MAG TPA: DUF983 domain-containing protein [Hyphomicrobium sp.]|nr:DUF983 domain-containing protein [Hyphomicrobium sp.]
MTVIKHIGGNDGDLPERDAWVALKRGWKQKCPACADGAMFRKYLKVNDICPACGEELHHHRADDAPPYFTMLITGHVVVGGILAMEQALAPPTWVQLAIWLPVLVLMSLWLLSRVKGALVAYQWANRMHGFGAFEAEGADIPHAEPRPAGAA